MEDTPSEIDSNKNYQNPEKSAPSLSCFNIFVAIFLGCLFGGLVGFIFGSMYEKGLTLPWYSLGMPPEAAQKIIRADLFKITIQSTQGQYYIFNNENGPDYPPSGRWIASDNLQDEWKLNPRCKIDASYASPPPSLAIDSSSGDYCGEFGFHVKYAILGDGSVWRWSTPGGFHSMIYGFNGCIIGSIAGFFVLALTQSIMNKNVKQN